MFLLGKINSLPTTLFRPGPAGARVAGDARALLILALRHRGAQAGLVGRAIPVVDGCFRPCFADLRLRGQRRKTVPVNLHGMQGDKVPGDGKFVESGRLQVYKGAAVHAVTMASAGESGNHADISTP